MVFCIVFILCEVLEYFLKGGRDKIKCVCGYYILKI